MVTPLLQPFANMYLSSRSLLMFFDITYQLILHPAQLEIVTSVFSRVVHEKNHLPLIGIRIRNQTEGHHSCDIMILS